MKSYVKMEEMSACRLCLATSSVVFDLSSEIISQNIENVLGYSIPVADGLPQFVCSFCYVMLRKCISFKHRCKVAQEVLNIAVTGHNVISMSFIRSLDRASMGLALPYTCSTPVTYETVHTEDTKDVKYEEIHDSYETKFEPVDYNPTDDYESIGKHEDTIYTPYVSEDEDDVPLAKHVKNVKASKKKHAKTSAKKAGRKSFDEDFATVVVLSKEQQLNEVKLRGNSSNYRNSPFKCDKCFKGFLEETAFNNHIGRHDPASGEFECDVCLIRCDTERKLRSHSVTTHERKFACKQCAHVSNTSNQAREHEKWHRGHTYNCQYCGETFRKATTHLTHVRIHHPTDFVCRLCGESFVGTHGLATHRKRMHKDKESKSELFCQLCDVRFKSSQAFNKHKESCSKRNDSNTPSKSCSQCGECFETEPQLLEHAKVHMEQPVRCEQCDAQFPNAKKCAGHFRRMHLGIKYPVSKTIVCEICGRKCTSNATLAYHQRTHTGEKPYQCSQCPKRFSVRQRLQIHSRTHTGERPYPCPRCHKAFRHKPALNRHARVHSGVKPYTCPYCGKSFSQSNSMKLHVHTVHLKLPPPYRNKKIKVAE